ncbi:MAG: hypothetical protein COA42_06155 [Alteromonadaceae bacterium]|nr:MAG: hypothetical protein COA42_06155 [Alteromonadaceae bacterium]
MKKISLSERANMIIKSNPSLTAMKPVIEKELIHYDIFFLLQQKNLILPEMTFIGGTCLRLCHGSNRYSEDLDFHAGSHFKPADFDKIRLELERYLYDRYQFLTEVRSPKQLTYTSENCVSHAHTWKVIIQMHPTQKNIPSQRIHIDIANIPTHEAIPMAINTNYSDLPDGYNTMLIRGSSKNEILADKLIAIPARNNIKARDLWDIIWLQQQSTKIDIDLIRKKIEDHAMTQYKVRLEARINEVPSYFETKHFVQEMSRFLDSQRLSKTVMNPDFIEFAKTKIIQTLTDLHRRLYSKSTEATFVL